LHNIKTFINAQSNPKGVLIIGHVTIPYSGFAASDDHGDHNGAWPADMYYGSTSSGWTDSTNWPDNSFNPDNRNVAGDGKFDQDYAPSPISLFTGRVDFANLPSFGTTSYSSQPEASLLLTYFQKAHNYRYNVSPSAFANKGIVYNGFTWDHSPAPLNGPYSQGVATTDQSIYGDAVRNCAALFPSGSVNLDVGDALEQKYGRSYMVGFLSGSGNIDRISDSLPYLQHTSANVATGVPAQIGVYTLLGSYFGDWNLTDDFLRAAIATPTTIQMPTYGLAAMWIGSQAVYYELHGLGLGETLGECALATINSPILAQERWSNLTPDDNARWVTSHGDPTLRLKILTPPSSLNGVVSGSSVSLGWAGNAQGQYHVYRGSGTAGPFTRLTASPVSGLSWQGSDDIFNRVYMVRGVATVTSGCGSYANLGQGTIATAHY
jgi:hypothetical protein